MMLLWTALACAPKPGGEVVWAVNYATVTPDGSSLTQVTFVPPEGIPAGTYQLIAFDPFDPDCNTAGQDAPLPIATFDENPPVCPEVTLLSGDVGFPPIPPGATGLEIVVDGLNLGTVAGGPDWTAELINSFPGFNPPLLITAIAITTDEIKGTISYDTFGFFEGGYDLVITPNDPSCPPLVFEDLVIVIGS